MFDNSSLKEKKKQDWLSSQEHVSNMNIGYFFLTFTIPVKKEIIVFITQLEMVY